MKSFPHTFKKYIFPSNFFMQKDEQKDGKLERIYWLNFDAGMKSKFKTSLSWSMTRNSEDFLLHILFIFRLIAIFLLINGSYMNCTQFISTVSLFINLLDFQVFLCSYQRVSIFQQNNELRFANFLTQFKKQKYHF